MHEIHQNMDTRLKTAAKLDHGLGGFTLTVATEQGTMCSPPKETCKKIIIICQMSRPN